MIAIIPARVGSKGLPGKNIKILNGIPLICHSIDAALNAKSILRVIVSTDDPEIAKIAKDCGAEVPFMRPKELAKDNSMVMDTYFYTVDKLAAENKAPVDSFVSLLPTVPLRLPRDIDAAVELFKKKQADSIISVMESNVPIQWYRRVSENGVLSGYMPEFNAVLNRQEFEKSYIPNGAVFIFNTERLRETREYYMEKTYPYIMPRDRSVDIDELLDFEWAEFLLKKNPKF